MSVLGSRQQTAQVSEHSLPPSYRARSRHRRGGSRIPEATTDVSITPEQQQHLQQMAVGATETAAETLPERVSENSQAATEDAKEQVDRTVDNPEVSADSRSSSRLSQKDLVTIVTISGTCSEANVQNATSEMDILAHL